MKNNFKILIKGSALLGIVGLLLSCGGSSSTPPAPENPMTFNLDFRGSFTGLPDTYGAASGQTGTWVDIPLGTTSGLVNTLGEATTVSIDLTGTTDTFHPQTTVDGILLRDSILNDDTFFNVIPFSATIMGLQDGQYDVYYYYHSPTSGMTINGTAMSNLSGCGCTTDADSLGAQGVNWDVVTGVTVAGGNLSIVDTNGGQDGLSGIQITRVP